MIGSVLHAPSAATALIAHGRGGGRRELARVPMIEEDKAIRRLGARLVQRRGVSHRLAMAQQGLIRYAHAGFPCWTFTRLLIMSGILR